MISKQHDVFPREDIIHLLQSKSCSKLTPKTYINRLVILVGVTLGIRSTALHELEIAQFQRISINNHSVWRYTEKIGSRSGASKVAKGGWKETRYKPVQIDIYNFSVLDNTLNVYKEIDEYLRIRSKMEKKNTRFFLQPSRKDPHKLLQTEFFNNQPIGVSIFKGLVKNMCITENLTGNGVHNYVTNHGLRGPMASLLLDAGFSDTTVSLRTGHRNNDSLKNYKNNQGGSSYSQQKALFESTKFEVDNKPQSYNPEKEHQGEFTDEKSDETKIPLKKRYKSEGNLANIKDLRDTSGVAIHGVTGDNFTIHVHHHISK